MRIFLTTDNIGGVWTWSMTLASALKGQGHDVIIAVTGKKLTDEQKNRLLPFTWFAFEGKLEWMPEPWKDVDAAGEWMIDIKESLKPDIVHLSSYSWASLEWNAPVVVTAHSCVKSWWESVRGGPLPAGWEEYVRRVGTGIRSANAVIAPGRAMMSAVRRLWGPQSYCDVIYNGADISGFHQGNKKKFIFSMGRLWDEAKNIRSVIAAATKSKYDYYVAGEFDRKLNIPSNVFLMGQLTGEATRHFLSEAAIYFLPVRYEPFGYTFLEAALSGCAIVTGDIESMREIWADDALYADPSDTLHMARLIDELMEDDEKREELAERARKRAIDLYSAERMANQYSTLYQELIRKYQKSNLIMVK